ncbi:uncharacterized protein LOC117117388 [Anneissia japonica]|uniref:uncharacterized protein LOC117117388 n=1 Tax=Anneissia japonica TaxID=1529436 RepID=UPI0014258247|nr:uncharacterized protein LOC117117388 [Anneissia japonica]
MSSHSTQGQFDYFNRSVDCSYRVTAMADFTKVMIDFRWFDISERYGDNTNCSHASLWLYDGTSSGSPVLLENHCGTVRPSVIESTGTSMTIRVVSDGDWSVIDFRAVFTVISTMVVPNNNYTECLKFFLLKVERVPNLFRHIFTATDCMSSDFMCSTTARCISKEVTCDRQNISNCGGEDYSDQSDNSPSFCPVNEPANLVPLWISLAVLGALSPFILYWCFWRPGYLTWICGCCRRRRCSNNRCSCCTKHSKFFCQFVFSGAFCVGCDCSDDSHQNERKDSAKRHDSKTPKSTREATTLSNVFIVVDSDNESLRKIKPNGSTKGVFLDDTGSLIVLSNIEKTPLQNESASTTNEPEIKTDNSKPRDNHKLSNPKNGLDRPGLGRRGRVMYEPESASASNSPQFHRRPPYRISPMPPQTPDRHSETNSPDGSFPSSQSLPSTLAFSSSNSTPTTGKRIMPPKRGVFLAQAPLLLDDELENGAGGHVREGR